MGTRNITRVKSDGQLKVCQYCQWDGYPTGAGADIIRFIRDSDDVRMAERLGHVTLNVSHEGDEGLFFPTGTPADDTLQAIGKDEWPARKRAQREAVSKGIGNLRAEYDFVSSRTNELLAEMYGEGELLRFLLATRDTGCKVLPLIYGSEGDIETWTTDYLMGNDVDWNIEAVWELDYDGRVLRGNWHGRKWEWTFDELREMDTDQISVALAQYEEDE